MSDEQKQNQDGASPPQTRTQAAQGGAKPESAKDPKKDAEPRQVLESRDDVRRKE